MFKPSLLIAIAFTLGASSCALGDAETSEDGATVIDAESLIEMFPECENRIEECLADPEILAALDDFAIGDDLEDFNQTVGEFAAAGSQQVYVRISSCRGNLVNHYHELCRRAGAAAGYHVNSWSSCNGGRSYKRHLGICTFR